MSGHRGLRASNSARANLELRNLGLLRRSGRRSAHNGQAVTVRLADRELIFRITLPNVPNLIPLAFRPFGAAPRPPGTYLPQ